MPVGSDPYVWLEKTDDPKVARWFAARDAATRKTIAPVSRLLQGRIRRRFATPYVLMVKTRPNGLFVLSRDSRSFKLRLIDAHENNTKLVDSSDLGKDAVLQLFHASERGDRYAYTYSIAGSDEGVLKVVETKSNEALDEVTGMFGDVAWVDPETYFYGRIYQKEKTPDGVDPPAMRILRREQGAEELVFGRGLPTSYFVSLKKSLHDARALLTVAYGWTKSDVYAGKFTQPDSWRLLYGGGDFITWPIDQVHGTCYAASFDKGGMGRVLALTEDGEPDEVVGEQPYPLQQAVATEQRLVATYLVNASSLLRTHRLDGQKQSDLTFNPAGTVDSLDSDGQNCVFRYESFVIPYRIYVLEDDAARIVDSREVRGQFSVEDVWVASKDGTRIHVFNVGKKGKRKNRVLVWGYGGFGIALTPTYFSYVVPFLEDGGEFAVANLRGGTEFGEAWHRLGMREKKQNVFDDFIAVLEHYRHRGSRTVSFGVSNGGLLVGATLTQRPELMDGALIGYPVLDMLRYHRLHIGKAWVPEYGDPEDPHDRAFLLAYSPYHNIRGRTFPPTLLYTGIHDDRVHPAHALKFAARLEEAGASPLLRVETKSGHSGATPKTKIAEYADLMAFVYKTLKLKP